MIKLYLRLKKNTNYVALVLLNFQLKHFNKIKALKIICNKEKRP